MIWMTLELAKKQVGIPLSETARDDRLAQIGDEAEAIVIQYLQERPEPDPPDAIVRAACYLQFAELWRFRGDDPDGQVPSSRIPGAPSPQVERCLYPRRPPSFA